MREDETDRACGTMANMRKASRFLSGKQKV
jgi:hypothetical protein